MSTSLSPERFKSFKDAELKLGPLTILFGANAPGKSNIRLDDFPDQSVEIMRYFCP